MKRNLSLALEMAGFYLQLTALFPILFTTHAAASCKANQYAEQSGGREICCNFCAAGEEISRVCRAGNPSSTCTACKKQYYNPENVRSRCKLCLDCNKGEGSIEIHPCTKSSNALCACPEGSTPKNERNTACRCDKGKEIVNDKCQPCCFGYFSTKENSVCHPWTNCSAKGEAILETGSATQDVKCTKPNVTVEILPKAVTPTPTHFNQERKATTSLQNFTSNHFSITEKTMPSNFLNSWMLSLILIGVILLSLSAGVILTMIAHTNRKKRNRGFIRGEKCRHPVQEESTSSDSSLAKQCPA